MSRFWIRGGTLVTMDPKRRIIKDGVLEIHNGKISAIGTIEEIPVNKIQGNVIDATGKIILPGFINAHTHADCILLRGGISQDRSLFNWLVNVLDPARHAYIETDIRAAINLYCEEAIRSGITTIVDNVGYFDDGCHRVAIETYIKMGIRVMYAPMFLDRVLVANKKELGVSRQSSGSLPTIETTNQAIKRIRALFKEFHGSGKGRIKLWVAPRLGRAMSTEGLARSIALAHEFDTMTTTHCAETKEESIGYEDSTVEYLRSSGYLSPRTVLAHCVWIDDKDILHLKDSGTKVAHNPNTNMFLGSGIAPIDKLINSGVSVGLGTDNANANNLVSIFSEMRTAALLQKAKNLDASSITAEEALEMATIQGSKVIGEEKRIGSLEIDKMADVIFIDAEVSNFIPNHHIPATLVYQSKGSEVTGVMVEGNIIMWDRKLNVEWDERELHNSVNAQSIDLTSRAGIDTSRTKVWKSRYVS